jgi:hypothetical protein
MSEDTKALVAAQLTRAFFQAASSSSMGRINQGDAPEEGREKVMSTYRKFLRGLDAQDETGAPSSASGT